MATRKRRPKGSGKVRRLPSGRYQAQVAYAGDYHPAPVTFVSKGEAEGWLAARNREIAAGTYTPPTKGPQPVEQPPEVLTLRAYAESWLRTRDLRPRTVVEYQGLLDRHILPVLGDLPIDAITPMVVREWHADCCPDKPKTRAKAYSLAKTIAETAVDDELLDRNPFRIRGAGTVKKSGNKQLPTPKQVHDLADAMPERTRLAVLLSAWCGLRLGEVTGLRRRDVDVAGGVLHVEQAAVKLPGGYQFGDPKTDAGRREVAIPPHILPDITQHLADHTASSRDALLFPSTRDRRTPISSATFYGKTDGAGWYEARHSLDLDAVRFHDLRHCALTWAAQVGATTAEVQARGGHADAATAAIYQHASSDRDRQIAAALSGLASGDVVPLRKNA